MANDQSDDRPTPFPEEPVSKNRISLFPITLKPGQKFDTKDYPGHAFLLIRGSLGVKGGVVTADGFDSKQVAVLDDAEHDLFFDDTNLPASRTALQRQIAGQIKFEYVALEANTQIRILTPDFFRSLMEDTKFVLLAFAAKERQILRTYQVALEAFKREYDARSHLSIQQGTFSEAISQARQEEQQKAQTKHDKERQLLEDAQARNLRELLNEFEQEKGVLLAEAERKLALARAHHEQSVSFLLGEVARLQAVEREYAALSTNFLNWQQKQREDATHFVELFNKLRAMEGRPPVTALQLAALLGDADALAKAQVKPSVPFVEVKITSSQPPESRPVPSSRPRMPTLQGLPPAPEVPPPSSQAKIVSPPQGGEFVDELEDTGVHHRDTIEGWPAFKKPDQG